MRTVFTFFSLMTFLLLASCGENKSPANTAADPMSQKLSPYLKVSEFTRDGCLNLELLTSYFDDSGFEYPGRATTYDYSSNKDIKPMFTRNFGVRDFQMKKFPFLKNVKQANCSEVTAETAYGRAVTYNVIGYDPLSIQLEAAEPAEAEVDKALLEARSSEPNFRKIQIRLASPTHLFFTVEAETLRSQCNNKSSFIYNKTTVFRWAPTPQAFPQEEEISQLTYDKVLEIVSPVHTPEVPTPVSNDEEAEDTGEVLPSETTLKLSIQGLQQIQKILPVVALEHRCD